MSRHLEKLIAAVLILFGAIGSAGAKNGWSAAGRLVTAVGENNAFALSDGRVVSIAMPQEDQWPQATQFWDGRSKTWTAAKSRPPFPHTFAPVATMLDDGRILLTGLCRSGCGEGNNAEIYDPAKDQWSVPGQMSTNRYLHSMVKLQDGRVLVLGGCTTIECWQGTRVVEVFDPKTNRFTRASRMKVHRVAFAATLLADGRVLVSGGYSPKGVLKDNEVYDPADDSWTENPPMPKHHVIPVAVLLHDGRVLVMGGDCKRALPCSAADLFNPTTGTWQPTGALTSPRDMMAAVVMQDGRVLVAGGQTYFGSLWQYAYTTEIYDPATGTFSKGKNMAHQRAAFSMTMLPNGQVLAVGGDAWIGEDYKRPGDSELYTPGKP